MSTTKISKAPGRPRKFDAENAVTVAQRLFHARGYDAVSVAELTAALDINPPSFYGVFGSKIGLYNQVLSRYSRTSALPFTEILREGRPVAEALTELLEAAARLYAGNETCTGCLVIEGTRCNDPQARESAGSFYRAAERGIQDFIASQYQQEAERLTAFMSVVMSGLSAKARQGYRVEQLLESARLAGLALSATVPNRLE